jgi:agmatinase
MPEDDGRGRMDFPFVGIPSFLRSAIQPSVADLDADVAFLGAPTDEGSPFMPGSRFGPRSIREHSLRFITDPPGYYDPQERRRYLGDQMADGRIADVGDADVLPTNVEDTFTNITALVAGVIRRGAMPVVAGGDHAVTFPVVRAFESEGPLHVIHFDAHLDYMPFVHGLRYTNQHAFRHIRLMPNVQSITQVGIRSLRGSQRMLEDSIRDGNRVVTMEEYRDVSHAGVLAGVPEGSRCYVSIDIDALDMPLVPGCVSAEPEGMSYGDLRDTLSAIAEHTEVVGFDLVEVNPQLDVATGITSYLAAQTIVEFLGRICAQPRWDDGATARAARREGRGESAERGRGGR